MKVQTTGPGGCLYTPWFSFLFKKKKGLTPNKGSQS